MLSRVWQVDSTASFLAKLHLVAGCGEKRTGLDVDRVVIKLFWGFRVFGSWLKTAAPDRASGS